VRKKRQGNFTTNRQMYLPAFLPYLNLAAQVRIASVQGDKHQS